jgi:hypothetical protein
VIIRLGLNLAIRAAAVRAFCASQIAERSHPANAELIAVSADHGHGLGLTLSRPALIAATSFGGK